MNDLWQQFKDELTKTNREGIDNLITYLDKETDFAKAPASTKFHLSREGGLLEHSLNVLKFARSINNELELKLTDDSIVVSALLHDLCKVNTYYMGEEWDKEYKDKTNQWRKKSIWKIQDNVPLGHGEKSAILASQLLPLKVDELSAIRWHMLKWDVSDSQKYTMQDAMDKFPLVKVIAIADQMAELYEPIN